MAWEKHLARLALGCDDCAGFRVVKNGRSS